MESSPKLGDRRPADEIERRALAALGEGDLETVLEILMDGYGDALYRFCRRTLGNAELADDVHQLTFVQAFAGLPGFRGSSTLKSWLYGIARHRCLDALKASRRWRARFKADDALPEAADPRPSPASRLESEAIGKILERCLGRLEPHIRQAVALRFEGDLSYPEMATICDERPATLQARVARAMPRLKRCVEEHGVSV